MADSILEWLAGGIKKKTYNKNMFLFLYEPNGPIDVTAFKLIWSQQSRFNTKLITRKKIINAFVW